jgi:hypothetical protein
VCDYKKIRKWLIIIPFFVLHIFGAPSIVSNLFLHNIFFKDPNSNNMFWHLGSCDEEDSYKNDSGKIERSRNFDLESFYTEGSGNNFLKNFIDKTKKHNNNVSKEVVVCDNRIDCIDKKFVEIIYSDNQTMKEKSLVALV